MTVLSPAHPSETHEPDLTRAGHPKLRLRVHKGVSVENVAELEHPERRPIGYLIHPKLRVTSAFDVEFSREGDQMVAEAPEFNEFGYGPDSYEALRDLQRALAELYFELTGDRELGADLQQLRERLVAHISPR